MHSVNTYLFIIIFTLVYFIFIFKPSKSFSSGWIPKDKGKKLIRTKYLLECSLWNLVGRGVF